MNNHPTAASLPGLEAPLIASTHSTGKRQSDLVELHDGVRPWFGQPWLGRTVL
jgi:hypothetical protein